MAQYCDNWNFVEPQNDEFLWQDQDNDTFEFWNGLRGPAGAAGPAGPPGTGLTISGTVASTAQLPETAPQGTVYNVGSAAPYTMYMYQVGTGWISLGQLEGPQGETGPAGADGTTFTPTVSSAGVISWTNDGGKQNPASVDIKGPQGETGPAGADGTTFTPTVSSAGVISWTNDGGKQNPASVNIKGPQGETGPQGPEGEPGKGLTISGTVASTAQLPQTAEQGTVYNVGSAAPYTMYMYQVGTGWISLGQLSGPAGADGTTFTPTVSSAGVISWTNDGGKQNPASVNIKGPQGETGQTGQAGPAGADGTTFTPTVSSAGVISWTNDGGKQNPASVNIKGPQGETGAAGQAGPAGPGVPSGGSDGQMLVKDGSTDYATKWANQKTLADLGGQASIEASGILKGNGSGGVSAATAGTDYQTPYKTTTLTIEASEWSNNSVTKAVSGMTATALVFVEFSDTVTVYTVTQSANALTFTTSAAPSSQITVKVGWFA